MNQTQTRSLRKKVLSLILAVVMAVSLLPISAFASGDSKASSDTATSTDFVRIFHLDCGRKYFSVSEIEGIIDQLAENHYTHLQLAFGNDGLRFLLNDMSVTVNGTEYASDKVTSAIKQGNKNLTSGSSGELSESEMDAIISYANDKGIQIIPLFNAPGHMYTVVSAMNTLNMGGKSINVSSPTDARTSNVAVDPTDTTAVSFAKALLQKYVTYFAKKGSTMFNIGADESGLSTANYASYAAMVNDMNAIVKKAGMTTLAYNDGIYNTAYAASQTDVKFDNDIIICYWTSGANSASVADFLSKGFKLLNNSDNWYYVLGDYLYTAWGKNGQWGYNDALNGIKSTPVTQMKDYTGTEKPIGSILCVWCDAPNQTYDSSKVYALIKAMADANPEYFTDEVKLPAADTSADVSIEVVGKKGETASVKAETITSAYTFDAENVVSYNVTPTVDGKAYSGSGTVTLPVPSGWEQNSSRIRAYIIDNGAVKMILGTYSDGKYIFDVPHFSEMGLLQLAENAGNSVDITITQDRSKSYTLSGDNLPTDGKYNTADGIVSYTVATTVAGKKAEEVSAIESGGTYIIGNGSQYLMLNGNSISKTDDLTKATEWTITKTNNGYTIESKSGYSLRGNNGSLSASTSSSTTWSWSDTDGFYYTVSSGWWGSTTYYYLTYSSNRNNWTLSYSSNDKGGSQPYTVVDVPGGTTVTFKGLIPGTTSVTLGDTTYNITVTEKQTVEIPISIIDYRADGLMFDWNYQNNSYAYGLVHVYSGNGSYSLGSITLGQTLDGANYGTKIAGTTLERTRTTGDVHSQWSDNVKNDNSWSRMGLVESELGSNGMPVYTKATVEYVAGLLSSGNYNAMSGSCNAVLQNTFLVSNAPRSVRNTSTTAFSEAFAGTKSYDNITTAYDLAWYLLNTIYQADTNMTTVTGTDNAEHSVPIYGMKVDAYKSIILTDDGDGTYSFNAGYSGNAKNILYDRTNGTISESDSGESTTGFYPINDLGYEQPGLLTGTSAINNGTDNGSFTLRGESQFVYEKDQDLYFTFTGDDDVYMYINGKLALDLGGAHGRNTKTVNLNDLDATYGLKDGEIATFTFFYMERCSDASTFGIETNMELVKSGISVAKKAYSDVGCTNPLANGAAVETDKSAYYDLIVTNQSNVAMNQISFADTDSRDGTANFGFGVENAAVSAGTKNTDGTVSLKDSGRYVIYVTDANEVEVSGTRKTPESLSELSTAVADVTLEPGQSLHVRFLQAEFSAAESKILNYQNTVNVTATVGNQNLSKSATHELYSYNVGDSSRTYVVDFGLPLKIEGIFDENVQNNVGEVGLSSTNVLKYGTVALNSNRYDTSLVYTRTADKTINDAETIVLDVVYKIGSSNVSLQKTLTIIPATTVYYEDSLATFTNGAGTASGAQWSIENNAGETITEDQVTVTNQALSALGSQKIYGYDDAYKDSTKLSMGSAHKVTVSADMAKDWTTTSAWPTATFTFKGTGFDVISLTDNNSGAISVKVYSVGNDGTETQVKGTLVNNYYGYTYTDGKWTATPTGDNNALYQIPVIKISGLDYGTYKVVITASYATFADKTKDNQYSFWLDAIRVYDPMGKDNATYEQDNEGYPQYIKLRDSLVNKSATVAGDEEEKMVFIDGGSTAEIATYANYGPNNEVYLAKGQAIFFNIPENTNIASIQIGAKAPNSNAAEMDVNGTKTAIPSATEMYYQIATQGGSFTVTNTGEGLLSLTNLKITYKASSTVALATLSDEDQANAVALVRALFAEPVEPFNPDPFTASWGHSVRKGDTATLTVKASEDTAYIKVDGETVANGELRTERTGWGWWAKTVTYREFTYTTTADTTVTSTIYAFNDAGVSSDAITATLTVRPSVRDWLHGIIGKWF